MSRLAKYLGMFFLWNVTASVALVAGVIFQEQLWGLAAALLTAAAVLWGYLLRGPRPHRRWALLRLRNPDRTTLRWTVIAIPVLLLTSWALGEVWVRLVPVPPSNFDPFVGITGTPAGRLSITLLAVAVAPVLEEFFFRGLIQHTLEYRLGPRNGIGLTAALFAFVHFLPRVFPLHFFLGLALGYAVYVTRSIWVGVILHAANNAAAVAGVGLETSRAAATPTIWETGPTREWWLALVVLVIAGFLLARTARELTAAGRLRGFAANE